MSFPIIKLAGVLLDKNPRVSPCMYAECVSLRNIFTRPIAVWLIRPSASYAVHYETLCQRKEDDGTRRN
jgi:hypothetical protein